MCVCVCVCVCVRVSVYVRVCESNLTLRTLTGQLWACRLPRRGRGRGTCLLMLGVFLCLLLPLLIPHPNPAGAHRPLRRIHQEEEDYTGPKSPPQEAKIKNSTIVSPIVRSSYSEVSSNTEVIVLRGWYVFFFCPSGLYVEVKVCDCILRLDLVRIAR